MINITQLVCAVLLSLRSITRLVCAALLSLRSITQLVCAVLLGGYSSVYLSALLGLPSQYRSVSPLSTTRYMQHYSVGLRSIIPFFFSSYLVNILNITPVVFAALLSRLCVSYFGWS